MSHINQTKKSCERGSESGSTGYFGTGLGGLLRGVRFILVVTPSDDESCNGD